MQTTPRFTSRPETAKQQSEEWWMSDECWFGWYQQSGIHVGTQNSTGKVERHTFLQGYLSVRPRNRSVLRSTKLMWFHAHLITLLYEGVTHRFQLNSGPYDILGRARTSLLFQMTRWRCWLCRARNNAKSIVRPLSSSLDVKTEETWAWRWRLLR